MDPNTDPNQPTPSAVSPQPQIQPEIQPIVPVETQYPPQPQQFAEPPQLTPQPEPQPVVNNLTPVKTDKSLITKIAIIVSIAVLIIGGVGAYAWRDGQANIQKSDDAAKIKSLQEKIVDLEAEASPSTQNLSTASSDTQRKNDLARLTTALTMYMANNRGALPSADNASWATFAINYLANDGETFADPSRADYILSLTDSLPASYKADNPIILVTPGAKCNGDSLEINQGTRKVAFQMRLEGGGIACSNN